jgi:hypothetical protein
MNSDYIISQLKANQSVFREIFSTIPEDLIYWKSSPEKWNLLEIVCHLYDEEREDFRARLNHVLTDPSRPLPKIDPVDWVISRKYADRNFNEEVINFLSERQSSVEWLLSLKNPAYDNAFIHSRFGPLSGKLFLSNWLAHDYLHIRQVLKIKYDYFKSVSNEKLDYAGQW